MASPSVVRPSESLGRYLTGKKHFSSLKGEVKFKAFMPPPDRLLSVYRIDGLSLYEVWDIGENNVVLAMSPPKTLYGVADIKAGIVERQSLKIEADDIPLRHANIVGWPEQESEQMLLAQVLAAEARLILKHQSP